MLLSTRVFGFTNSGSVLGAAKLFARSRKQSLFSTAKLSSLWHDVPLRADVSAQGDSDDPAFNFICEIPSMTSAKMEISTTLPNNPIVQDRTKDDKPRFYHGPIYWNYGCLPQTWEDPRVLNEQCDNTFGDNDPLDVVEIGSEALPAGSVTPVRILGALGLIDCGELDWKLIAVRTTDPLVAVHQVRDLQDLGRVLPHHVDGIREWFRWYKRPDGKPLNEYAMGGRAVDREGALAVVQETHEQWKRLVSDGGKVTDTKRLWVK
jgi:inorganic pyrophosphatase